MSIFRILKMVLLVPLWLLFGLIAWGSLSLISRFNVSGGPLVMGIVSLVVLVLWVTTRKHRRQSITPAEGIVREYRTKGETLR